MSRSSYYFLSIVSVGVLGMGGLLSLYWKYNFGSIDHLVELCGSLMRNVETAHWLGLMLLSLVVNSVIAGVGKGMFSWFKTHQRVECLLKVQVDRIPGKLMLLVNKHKLELENLMVIDQEEDCAVTIGARKPMILLSVGTITRLSSLELEAVLLHEDYHRRSRHGLWLMVAEFLKVMVFWLPVTRLLVVKMRKVFEQEADRYVAGKQQTGMHLRWALVRFAGIDDGWYVYPQFSVGEVMERLEAGESERELSLRRFQAFVKLWQVWVSLLVIAGGIWLWIAPQQVQVRAEEALAVCNENQCLVGCEGEKVEMVSKLKNYTPAWYSPMN